MERYIRTYVPIAIGYLITQLVELTGAVDIDTEQVALATTGIVIALYYAAVSAAEKRWPAVGWLLGSTKQPTYQ